MNKYFLIPIFFLIFVSGCTNFNEGMNRSVENVTQGIINEMNETLSNISNQINESLNQGLNDSINNFVSGLLNITNNAFLKSPISTFTLEDINYLGVNCQGSDLEIANCIKDWQENNMIYLGLIESSTNYPGAADAIHWNYAIPGIFPTKEVIRQRSEGNKPYGVCYDYATIYCSIADYYGLSCRVANTITKPSQRPNSGIEFTTGLRYEEYERLKIELDKQGLDYDFILMNKVLRETPEHYWSEVLIDDEWIVIDGSGTDSQTQYKDANDWEVTNWTKLYLESNISYYLGFKDDLNNRIKVFNIDDYMFSAQYSLGLPVPYYSSCTNVCGFFEGKNPMCTFECPFLASFFSCYDSCSGKKFYKICDYVCNDEEAGYEECYQECSGEELDIGCFNDC
ncbi:MAG: transglutaminase domain-containing protein [Candidatus Nanoarchaeia archaeon]|jgi:hypothetical protein